MLFSETYQEVQSPVKGFYKEKGSKFISYIYPISSLEEVKDRVKEIKEKEKSAQHYCYAFLLYPDKSASRTNDDGEPPSTAGKPILGQINAHDLTNTLVIVVRYFGGVKLGISGLIRAYKNAAKIAISNATIITKTIKENYQVYFKYQEMNIVMKIIKEYQLEIQTTNFKTDCILTFAVEKTKANNVINRFRDYQNITIKYLKTS